MCSISTTTRAEDRIDALDRRTDFNSSAYGWDRFRFVHADGEHYTYCTKTSPDRHQSGRPGIRTHNGTLQMPLTFPKMEIPSAWAQDNTIFINGKPGPKGRYLPQVMFSPDGSHYAYTGTVVGGNDQWAFVDGRQVNILARSINIRPPIIYSPPTTIRVQRLAFCDDGKPVFKAYAIRNVWTSPEGKQIAFEIQRTRLLPKPSSMSMASPFPMPQT